MAAILCIDDDSLTRKTLTLLLQSKGYDVHTAENGPEGLRLLGSRKFDLIVLDYWMAGTNGIAVAKEIKSKYPNSPIVMLSGFGELPGEAIGIVDRWIMKGPSGKDLLVAIRHLLVERDESTSSPVE